MTKHLGRMIEQANVKAEDHHKKAQDLEEVKRSVAVQMADHEQQCKNCLREVQWLEFMMDYYD